MRIREGRGSDLEAGVQILRDSPEYFNEEGVRQGERYLADESTMVAEDDSGLLGFATAARKSPEVAEFLVLAVAPMRRGRGVGRRWIGWFEDRSGAQGAALLQVRTLAEEPEFPPYEGVRRLYRANGFHHVETVNPVPGGQPGNPCATFVRPLGSVHRGARLGRGRQSRRDRAGRALRRTRARG